MEPSVRGGFREVPPQEAQGSAGDDKPPAHKRAKPLEGVSPKTGCGSGTTCWCPQRTEAWAAQATAWQLHHWLEEFMEEQGVELTVGAQEVLLELASRANKAARGGGSSSSSSAGAGQ